LKITELRQYRIKAGKTKQWLSWMKEELLPYQRSQGMRVLNTYVHTGDDGHDYFVWLREFDNEQARQTLYEKTYNEWWVCEIRPKVFELIEQDSIKVTLLESVEM